MTIPKGAPNKAGAEAFINFLCDPENAKINVEYIEYSTPNYGAYELLDDDVKNNPVAYPPEYVFDKCSIFTDLDKKSLKLYEEAFMDVLTDVYKRQLMSCNARLPVYSIFASVFFPKYVGLVVASLYFLGIILAFILGIIFKHLIFKNEEEPLLIELPEYKLPSLKNLFVQLYEKSKNFLIKAGTLIFAMSIILWFLSNFNFSGMTDVNDSILA